MTHVTFARWLFIALMAMASAWAEELPRGNPAELGFSAERLAGIDKFYGEKVKQGQLAGIVTLVARHGKIAHFSAVGFADVGKRTPMRTDTLFRLYSMTKPVAAVALMMLYEEGRFQLDDPISKYLPEFAKPRVLRTSNSALDDTVPAAREPTIHDLFRHTAGLSLSGRAYDDAGIYALDASLKEVMSRLSKLPLNYQPGSRWEYGIAPDVEARLVEVLSGMPFDQFLQQRVFGPLGMNDTAFWVRPDQASRLSAVHWFKDGKLVPMDASHGYPDPVVTILESSNINSYTADMARKGGSYGLVGSTADYWRFAQMLLNGGTFAGHRVLGPQTVRYMASDHLGSVSLPEAPALGAGVSWGLGFAVVKNPATAGVIGSEGAFYWAGAANTCFWIDPKEDLIVVLMTQHLDAHAIDWPTLRSQMSAMVYGALLH